MAETMIERPRHESAASTNWPDPSTGGGPAIGPIAPSSADAREIDAAVDNRERYAGAVQAVAGQGTSSWSL